MACQGMRQELICVALEVASPVRLDVAVSRSGFPAERQPQTIREFRVLVEIHGMGLIGVDEAVIGGDHHQGSAARKAPQPCLECRIPTLKVSHRRVAQRAEFVGDVIQFRPIRINKFAALRR